MPFRGIETLFCLSLLMHLGKSDYWLGDTFDPEETAFVFSRCIEDNAEAAASDGLRWSRIERWINWELESGDEDTQHYVECLLRNLVLFGEKFEMENLHYQYELFVEYTNSSLEFPTQVWNSSNLMSNYASAYEAFTEIIEPQKSIFREIYFLDKELSSNAYEYLPIKQPNQSIFQFCENRLYSYDLELTCDARNYSIPQDEQFPKHMDCIFRGLRYFDRYDDFNMKEIIRDFHQIGVYDLDEVLANHLRNCQLSSIAKRRALEYYHCLLNSTFESVFKEAFDYREIRSMNYDYALVAPVPQYNRTLIQDQVNKIHRELCGQ